MSGEKKTKEQTQRLKVSWHINETWSCVFFFLVVKDWRKEVTVQGFKPLLSQQWEQKAKAEGPSLWRVENKTKKTSDLRDTLRPYSKVHFIRLLPGPSAGTLRKNEESRILRPPSFWGEETWSEALSTSSWSSRWTESPDSVFLERQAFVWFFIQGKKK